MPEKSVGMKRERMPDGGGARGTGEDTVHRQSTLSATGKSESSAGEENVP